MREIESFGVCVLVSLLSESICVCVEREYMCVSEYKERERESWCVKVSV